jgi:hypothetical protein
MTIIRFIGGIIDFGVNFLYTYSGEKNSAVPGRCFVFISKSAMEIIVIQQDTKWLDGWVGWMNMLL